MPHPVHYHALHRHGGYRHSGTRCDQPQGRRDARCELPYAWAEPRGADMGRSPVLVRQGSSRGSSRRRRRGTARSFRSLACKRGDVDALAQRAAACIPASRAVAWASRRRSEGLSPTARRQAFCLPAAPLLRHPRTLDAPLPELSPGRLLVRVDLALVPVAQEAETAVETPRAG